MPGGWDLTAFFRPGSPARAGRPGAGTARPGRRRTVHRAGALDSGAAAARLRVPGAAGPGRDLGRPRAVRDALATVEAARLVLAGTGSALLARADELEALLRLSLGDLRPRRTRGRAARRPPRSAAGQDRPRRRRSPCRPGSPAVVGTGELTPRQALVRQLLLAAAAIGRGDPAAAGIVGGVLHTARHGVSSTPSSPPHRRSPATWSNIRPAAPDPFTEQLIAAAMRCTPPSRRSAAHACRALDPRRAAHPGTPADQHLPADGGHPLRLSQHGKTHLRSIYQKLGVASRSQAIERAVDLRLL